MVAYSYRYRFAGKQRWVPLGLQGNITPAEARTLAKKRAGEVANGRDPAAERKMVLSEVREASANGVDAVLDNFIVRHVRRNLRSSTEVERVFNRYVRPHIGSKSIY